MRTFDTDISIALGQADRRARLDSIASLQTMPGPEATAALASIARRRTDDQVFRLAATVALTERGGPESEVALRRLLRDETVPVRIRAARGLGRIGQRASLRALDNLPPRRGPEAKELALAKTLIAYRNGVARDDIRFVRGVRRRPGRPEQMLPLRLRTSTAKRAREAIASVGERPYEIGLDPGFGFDITIGRARWVLGVNQDALGRGVIPDLMDRRLVTGLMLRHARATGQYSVQYIILTRPGRRGDVQILVMRTDGELMYSGHAGMSSEGLGFELRDLDRPATAPTRVEGRLVGRRFELETVIPFGSRREKQTAEAMPTRVKSRAELAR